MKQKTKLKREKGKKIHQTNEYREEAYATELRCHTKSNSEQARLRINIIFKWK